MRRLLTFVVLMLSAVPFGISVAGCSKSTPVTYCDGSDSGPVLGQVAKIDLEPRLTGISLNEGQIGGTSTPTASDCRADSASVTSYTYGTTNAGLVDIEPTNGRLCAGTWNRNTGGGIADHGLGERRHQQRASRLRASGRHQHHSGHGVHQLHRRSCE
jgi:hypothetical protein